MKKIYLKFLVTILIIIGSFSVSFANEGGDADYNETKKSIDSYIDNQLEKIDLKEMQKYIKESSTIDDIDLKLFIKDLIKGEKNILDLFDKENIKILFFDELKSSIKVSMIILVLALLSSLLKSLDNSFSSNAISQITTYIVFITMVSLTLIGFKDVLEICNNTIDSTIGVMQVIMLSLIHI